VNWQVIDEADKVIDEEFSIWLPQLLAASHKEYPKEGHCLLPKEIVPVTSRHETPFRRLPTDEPVPKCSRLFLTVVQLQKILMSATLTLNPEKLSPLKLFNTQFFAPLGRYELMLPSSLKVLLQLQKVVDTLDFCHPLQSQRKSTCALALFIRPETRLMLVLHVSC
jgi:hypothetical protein